MRMACRTKLWALPLPALAEIIHCNRAPMHTSGLKVIEMSITRVGRSAVGFRTGTAAAAAKSLQLCPTLCDPIDGSPSGSTVPEILQARTLEWDAISFCNAGKWKVKVKSLSRVRLLATPRTAAHQAPLSMGFSRQEYWSTVPLPSLGTAARNPECPVSSPGLLHTCWVEDVLRSLRYCLSLHQNHLSYCLNADPWISPQIHYIRMDPSVF